MVVLEGWSSFHVTILKNRLLSSGAPFYSRRQMKVYSGFRPYTTFWDACAPWCRQHSSLGDAEKSPFVTAIQLAPQPPGQVAYQPSFLWRQLLGRRQCIWEPTGQVTGRNDGRRRRQRKGDECRRGEEGTALVDSWDGARTSWVCSSSVGAPEIPDDTVGTAGKIVADMFEKFCAYK